MLMRIVRRVSLGEVSRRVTELEGKYGGGLGELTDGFAGGQADRERFEDYIEWLSMIHALRAYGEGEDFEYYTEETVELSWSEASKMTPRRWDLLYQLSTLRVNSISDLAVKTGRDVKNVFNDLKILEQLGFVSLVKQGRRTLPELLVQEVTLLLG